MTNEDDIAATYDILWIYRKASVNLGVACQIGGRIFIIFYYSANLLFYFHYKKQLKSMYVYCNYLFLRVAFCLGMQWIWKKAEATMHLIVQP
jgi:hypothetical protein